MSMLCRPATPFPPSVIIHLLYLHTSSRMKTRYIRLLLPPSLDSPYIAHPPHHLLLFVLIPNLLFLFIIPSSYYGPRPYSHVLSSPAPASPSYLHAFPRSIFNLLPQPSATTTPQSRSEINSSQSLVTLLLCTLVDMKQSPTSFLMWAAMPKDICSVLE